jgi:transposase
MPKDQNPQAREAFRQQILALDCTEGTVLWFLDESGFEGDPKPSSLWAKKGSKPRMPYYGAHIRTNVIGAVSPHNGRFVSLMMPYVNTDVFQLFLNELNTRRCRQKRNIVVLDNASWHKVKRLDWKNLHPLFLPTYSPDFNPIEQLWRVIKENHFSLFATKDHDVLDAHLLDTLRFYSKTKKLVKSICTMRTFH